MEDYASGKLDAPIGVRVQYSIKWLASQADVPAEVVMERTYEKSSNPYDRIVAEKLMARFPSVTKEMREGKAKDIELIGEFTILLATPPRLYEQWGFDFLKVDICITGIRERETDVRKVFEEEKKQATERRNSVPKEVVPAIKQTLEKLVEGGLVSGVMGRGSYFGKNCFPTKDDNVNFMLLTEKPHDEVAAKIVEVLREIPRFEVNFIRADGAQIKAGEPPTVSFMVISKKELVGSAAADYNIYVLEDSVGIDLGNLPKAQSESKAREFAAVLRESNA